MEESDFLQNLKDGNKSAFNHLLSLYRDRVINICYRFLLNQDDAEDVSQEVFIEIYQSMKSFRGDARLSTWIYRIVLSEHFNHHLTI